MTLEHDILVKNKQHTLFATMSYFGDVDSGDVW